LKDVIVGKIYFLLVRIKIKHMELSIIRRETTGAVPNQYNESETITKFEIMDGAPVRGASPQSHPCFSTHPLTLCSTGETIPIRLFLGGFELTPTFREVNKKFSTRYYLNLVLIDEENRRYFKQQVRRGISTACPAANLSCRRSQSTEYQKSVLRFHRSIAMTTDRLAARRTDTYAPLSALLRVSCCRQL